MWARACPTLSAPGVGPLAPMLEEPPLEGISEPSQPRTQEGKQCHDERTNTQKEPTTAERPPTRQEDKTWRNRHSTHDVPEKHIPELHTNESRNNKTNKAKDRRHHTME